MRILALDLENTKSYQTGHIGFTDGVNAIVGHNGAGKSTILEAIGFVLFDSLNGYKHSDFVREGAKSATVTVTFVSNLDERHYQVTRRCGATNQYFVQDPELGIKLCEGKTDVTDFLRRHMGVDPTADLARLFSDAVGVPQGTFTAAFLQTPAQRKTIFDPLLQVEEYKQAVDKLLVPYNALKDQRNNLALDIARLETRLEGLVTLETLIAQRTEALSKAQSETASLTVQLQAVVTERAALEVLQQQVVQLQHQQQQTTQQLVTITDQWQRAEQAYAEASQAHALVQANQTGYALYQQMQTEQQQLEAQQRTRQQQERQLATLEKQLSALEAEAQTLVRELDAVTSAEALVHSLAAAVAEQSRLEAELALAQQAAARLEDARTQVVRQQADCQRLRERATALQAQLAEGSRQENARRAAESQIEQLRTVIDANKEALARYKVEADAAKEQSAVLGQAGLARCPLCEQPLTEAHRQQLLQRNDARLGTLREQYKTQQQQIKQDEAGLQTHQQTIKQIEQMLRILPRADEQVRVQQEFAAAEQALAGYQQRVEQLSAAPAQVEALQNQLVQLGNPRQRSAIAAATVERRASLLQHQTQLTTNQASLRAQWTAAEQALAAYQGLDAALTRVTQALGETLAAYQAVLVHQRVAGTKAARAEDVTRLQALHTVTSQALEQQTASLTAAQSQFDQTHYATLVTTEQTLRNRQGALQAESMLYQQELTRAQRELAELQTQSAALETVRAQAARLDEKVTTLETVRGLLRQAGPYITKALIKQISDGAAQIFSELMQDFTRHLHWGEDYGLTLEVDGRERQFAQLSGGEQMSAALALRLALLREMSNIDIAFFDEPTTNLDETRRDSLARQILDVRGFRQLFVISHDDTFEQVTQNLIRVERVNGVSSVVQS